MIITFRLFACLCVPCAALLIQPQEQSNSKEQLEGQTHIIQVGDEHGFQAYDMWVQTVQMFATWADWAYSDSVLPSGNTEAWYHRQKPALVNKTLHELPEGDTLLYLDLDVAVDRAALKDQRKSNTTSDQGVLLQILAGSNPDAVLLHRNTTCDFIGQDGLHTINSGALVFRASAAGRKLANLYADRAMKRELPMDQIALQSAVMSLAIPTYNEECDVENAVTANGCYDRTMSAAGYSRDKRSFDTYCILTSRERFNMHDDDQHYERGDILYHGKSSATVRSFSSSWRQ